MITPVAMDDKLLADIRAARADANNFHLWWLGQSGFLLQWQDRHLLIDPYLSDSLTKKYASTDKPHVRMTRLAIQPERLDFINVVTSSHNHTDHLDGETLCPLLRANVDLTIIVPEANRQFAADRLSVSPDRLTGIDDGQVVTTSGFEFHAIPAAHEHVDRDKHNRCLYLGYVIQFGSWKLFHSGDTMMYPGFTERLEPFGIDVAILPINGRAPERRVAGNLWGREAARLANGIRARHVIPCHFDMFEFNTAAPDEFVSTCQSLQQPYTVLNCGQRWSSSSLGSNLVD